MKKAPYTESQADSIKESRNYNTLEKSVTPRDKNDNKQEFSLEIKNEEFQTSLPESSLPEPSLPEPPLPEPSLIGKL